MRRNRDQGGAAAEARKTQECEILGSKMNEQRAANCCPSGSKNNLFI